MPACPACGSEVVADATECPRCHLAIHLFEAVREAIGVPQSDPRYSDEVHELLRAVESDQSPGATPLAAGPGSMAYPARFPAIASPGGSKAPDGPVPPPLDAIPSLPALPSGGVAGLRRQIDGYLQIARSLGLDLANAPERTREAIQVDDRSSLEQISRDLFVRIAAALSEEYESAVVQRNALTNLVGTKSQDEELLEARESLLGGDVQSAYGDLSAIREQLRQLEEHWETVKILVVECDLLADTIRELGGDAGPAWGPYEEGCRLAREGVRDEAEPVLAGAALALWTVLYPKFGPELRRIKDAMLAQRTAGMDVRLEIALLRELANHLHRRNFGSTIATYRRLRDSVAASGPAAPTAVPASAVAGTRPG
ncbi:MAG: hypothetical protein L3K08_07765 [Thermoplasmata archaeon]|nr:hypothetical protein [Thermoplasmata archaeon]